MQKTKVLLGEEARSALKKGIDTVYEPVSRTIGAKGRNSVYQEGYSSVVTNDGVTICRNINPEDPFEAMGADMIKQASERTNEEAGDGTTTSVVLATAIIEEGLKEMANGENPMIIRRKLEEARDEALVLLKEMAVPVIKDEDLLSIAKVSVEDDKTAEIVATSVREAGQYGSVLVDYGYGYGIDKEKVNGYFWNKGYISPYMVTNDRMESVMENCAVLLTDRAMNLNKDLLPFLGELFIAKITDVLLVADTVEGELLSSIVANRLAGKMNILVVRRPDTVEELEDLAALTGSIVVTKEKGMKDFNRNQLGIAEKVVAKKDSVVVIGKENKFLSDRVEALGVQLEEDKDNEKLKERAAKLSNGITILKVGAKTEADRKYLKLKVDDAVGACRAALAEGVVAGGGVTLKDIAKKIKYQPLAKALTRPYEKILENAGIKNDGFNYNVLTGEKVKDMIKAGIIDPAKVTRCVLENAVSLAKTFLTIESATAVIPKESAQK